MSDIILGVTNQIVEKQISVLKPKYRTPDWLFAMPVGAVLRADRHPDFPALHAFMYSRLSEKIFLDLTEFRIALHTIDLLVKYRGLIEEVHYQVAPRENRIEIPRSDHLVTITTNIFPGVSDRGKQYGAYWATFDN